VVVLGSKTAEPTSAELNNSFFKNLTISILHGFRIIGTAFGILRSVKIHLKPKDMKKLIITSIVALLFAGSSSLTAQNWPDEYLGLPGDNLNLFAVMNLFQESETLEGFERSLNDPDKMINNLDLNGDNYVDYLMVFDYVEGNVHTIVIRVALNKREYQDVAVFTVEKFRDGSVQVQLIGDEALYGPNYIVEPYYAETPNPGYRGNVTQTQSRNVTVVRTTYYEVAHWPVIVYISRPVYRPWRSVYYYGYYPVYWRPWTPHYWHFYYGYHYNWHSHYYAYYRPWRHHRCGYYHTGYYTGIRNYSPVVIVNINKGTYKNTYSRPDTRKQGEVLYTQRHGSGSTTGRNATVNRGAGRNSTQAASANSARVARQENTARTSAATSPARTNTSAARQGTETGRRQEATVNTSRDNRGQAVQSNAARQSSTARPAAEAPRNQNTRVTNSRNNTGAAVQNNAAPRRETSAPPARNVSAPASDRNKAATQSPPARVSPNRSNSGSSSAVRTQPARTNSQPSGNVSSPSRSSSRNSGTSVQRSETSNRNSGTSVQRSGSKNNQKRTPARQSERSSAPSRR
jgi:hypothetical protein